MVRAIKKGALRPAVFGDELIDKGAIHHRRIVGCMRPSCPELGESSDRGLVDPQSPPLAQAHQ
jgi:hypothetical protein